MELNVSRTGKYIGVFAEKGGCWLSVQAEIKGRSLYISSLSGAKAGNFIRPTFKRLVEIAKELKLRRITTDLIRENEKLVRLAKIAGFKKALVRSALGLGYDRSRKVGATPMYLSVKDAEKFFEKK